VKFPFFHYAFDAYIDIFRDGGDGPVFHTQIGNCAAMKYMRNASGWECLETSASHRNVSFEEEWIIPIGARIRVNPHISVEMYQPSVDQHVSTRWSFRMPFMHLAAAYVVPEIHAAVGAYAS
jgi:hypothetical protein